MFWMIATIDTAFADDAARDEMGTKIVSALVEGMGMQEKLADKIGEMAPAGMPEAWKPLWKQAAMDELAHDLNAICAIEGKLLATKLTEPQLATGVELMTDPLVVKALVGRVKGETVTLEKKDEKAVAKKLKSAEATSFLEAMKGAAGEMGASKEAIVREVLPGMLKRFGEAAEKAESGTAG